MTEERLDELASFARTARLLKKWSKEQAAREAGVSSITYKRVEDGLPVQDAKRAAIITALDLRWPHDMDVDVMPTWGRGGPPDDSSVRPATDDDPEFEFLTRVREDLTDEEMDQLMNEARPYLEMLVRDIKNRNRRQ